MALAAFDLRADSTLAVPRRLELGDKTRLLVFVKRAAICRIIFRDGSLLLSGRRR